MENIFLKFENQILNRMKLECEKHPDPSHDFSHVLRVVSLAKKLSLADGANLDITMPAAYLHDVVIVSKSDPRRSHASRLSADEATLFLKKIGYPLHLLDEIYHAIEAHSFSANKQTNTIEAAVVQDADRLDGLGAIGIARCFSLSGKLNRSIYSAAEPFAETRILDDQLYTLDHFYIKLLKIEKHLKTKSGKIEGQIRTNFIFDFIKQLKTEI